MGGGSTNTTTTKAEPWKAARPSLEQILGYGKDLYDQGGFSPTPYGGDRQANLSDASRQGYRGVLNRGTGSPWITQAHDVARGMMDQDPRLAEMARTNPALARMMSGDDIYADLGQVKQQALGSAVPAAMSMFTGNGMTDSSAAMDTVGRAATEAVAPIDYEAWQGAQDRALAAAGQDSATRMGAIDLQGRQQATGAAMMPGLQAARYLPSQMMSQAGAGRDAYNQQGIEALMRKWYEDQGQDLGNLQGYSGLVNQIAGQGGNQATINSGGGGFGQTMGTGALTGLGTFGALAGIPGIGMPMAIGGGILGGLAGMM